MSKKKETVKEIFASCCFSSLGLDSTLCDQLRERLGFEAPTKVQAQAIPVILSGRDVLVNAATGTGKTVAYLAPIINHLQSYSPRIDRSSGTFALVLVPTSELCLLVYEILQKLLHRFRWIVPGYVMGGGNRSKEKARLRKGISILVATPGHLLDHLQHTSSFLHTNLRWIIFDEADRILELGFGKEIEEILDILGSRNIGCIGEGNEVSNVKRQNLLLSATLNEKVNHLAKISIETPVLIGLDEKKLPEDKSNVPRKKSSSSKPPLPRKKMAPRSLVWQHFTRLPNNNKKCKCNYCGNEFECGSVGYGTSTLRTHYQEMCQKYKDFQNNQTTLTQDVGSDEIVARGLSQDDCRRATVKMIVLDELPFFVVENPDFKYFCSVAAPRYLLPSRRTITRDTLNMYVEEKAKLKSLLVGNKQRVSLTTDIWISITIVSCMVITTHFIDND